MPDQAESLRRLVLQAAPPTRAVRRGSLVLVHDVEVATSASSFSVQLALAWQRRRESAAFIEIGRHAEPSSTRLASFARATLCDVSRQDRTLREAWVTGPCGLSMAAGDLSDEPLHNDHPLVLQMQQAAEEQRIVVGLQELADMRSLLCVADHCVFVSTADADVLTRTYRAIKAVAADLCGARCWLAMDQVSDTAVALELQSRIVNTCDRCLNLALGPLGCLPGDRHGAAGQGGGLAAAHPFVDSSYRQTMEQMCACMDATHVSRPRRTTPRKAA